MHALAALTGAMGRCGKGSKTCGQLIQQVGLETCAPIGNEDRATRRFKKCASSEPTVNVVRSRRKRDASKETDDRLVNHYTINIYLNEAPKDRVLYADDKSSQFSFSVDKLTKTIATNSPVIEGFLRNKDPDKDRDYIEEKLGTFWKHVFENSKLEQPSGVNKQKSSSQNVIKLEKKSETNLTEPRCSEKVKEDDDDKKEPFFLSENQNEKIYVNKELQLETRKDECDLATPIPHYERGFYDSRTVKPKKIISPDNQSRRRLSQDVEEVNKHIKDLVELSTRSQTKESGLSKIITYCKSFLTKDTKPKASSGGYPKGSLFPTGVLDGRRRYHQATWGYLETVSDTAKNHDDENRRILCRGSYLTKGGSLFRSGNEGYSSLFRSGIVGGCYGGKRGYHRATLEYLGTDIKKSYLSTQQNKNESGNFLNEPTLAKERERKKLPKVTNPAKQTSRFALHNLILSSVKSSKPTLPLKLNRQTMSNLPKLDKASQSKTAANLGGKLSGLRPKQKLFAVKKVLQSPKVKPKFYKLTKINEDTTGSEKPKSICKKILRKRKRKMKSENEISGKNSLKTPYKIIPIYSATFSNERKARDASNKLKKPASVTRTFPTLKTIPFKDSLMKQIGTADKKVTKGNPAMMASVVHNLIGRRIRANSKKGIAVKYRTSSVFNGEIGAMTTQRHPGFRVDSRPLLAKPKKQIGSFTRTVCQDKSGANKKKGNFENICKKQKRHGKKECPPTSQRLAVRDSDCPKEPLKYQEMYPRCDESLKSAIPQKDPVAEIKGLLDNSKKEQFDCYFGEGGYKNYEYYSYTTTSFYDVNNYMTPSRNPQPSSGAKPK